MELFGMGLGEIALALIVALIIWGPGKLPELAQKAGKLLAQFRSLRADVTAMVRDGLLEEQENTHTPTKQPPTQEQNAITTPENPANKDKESPKKE